MVMFVGAWVFAAGPAAAEVQVVETTITYDVHGRTAAELQHEMSSRGPTSRFGGTPSAQLRAQFEWSFDHRMASGACRITAVSTIVYVEYVLPRWVDRAQAPARLQASWNRTFAGLKRHEDQHARYSKEAARHIDAAIAATPPQRTCAALQEAAHARGRAIVRENNAQNIAFDRRTEHGLKNIPALRD